MQFVFLVKLSKHFFMFLSCYDEWFRWGTQIPGQSYKFSMCVCMDLKLNNNIYTNYSIVLKLIIVISSKVSFYIDKVLLSRSV